MNEEVKRIANLFVEQFLNKNDAALANELIADDFINHNPQFGFSQDKEGMKQMIASWHRGFSNVQFILEDLIAENDKVVLHMRITGKHNGVFMGLQPTKRSIDSRSITILRLENGRIKERWNVTNKLETMRQLGLM